MYENAKEKGKGRYVEKYCRSVASSALQYGLGLSTRTLADCLSASKYLRKSLVHVIRPPWEPSNRVARRDHRVSKVQAIGG